MMSSIPRSPARGAVLGAIAGVLLGGAAHAQEQQQQQQQEQRPVQREAKQPQLPPEVAATAREAMVEWLECEECTEGQLEAVLEFGSILTPSLAATLREGPSQASRELLRRELNRRYDELVAYQKAHPERIALSSRDTFVRQYMENFDALYRVRAARALAAIGTPGARRALEEASRRDFRSDVRAVLEESLKQVR